MTYIYILEKRKKYRLIGFWCCGTPSSLIHKKKNYFFRFIE